MSTAGALTDTLALAHVGVPTSDGATGYTEPRTTYATVRAAVESASASWIERLVGVQVQAPATRLVRIYYRADVVVTDVATWTDRRGGTHTLFVRGLQVDPKGQWLWLACEERLPANAA